jgi:hypothetical protein
MKLFISDIKFIAYRPVLLIALLSPVIFTIFLLFLFPFISGLNNHEDALAYGRYYSLTAITLASAVPFIYGILFSFVHLKEVHSFSTERAAVKVRGIRRILISRMDISAVLSFILVLPMIYFTDAVSTEGWLRSIFVSLLLATMAPFIFLFITGFSPDMNNRNIISFITLIFLITVPAGLLLHHPWNYFIFFSPFYWISWAWVIGSPSESLIYGMISMFIAFAGMLIFYRFFLKNSRVDSSV